MTYGEAYVKEKSSMRLANGDWIVTKVPQYHTQPRMKRSEAGPYYTKKIRNEFLRLGYEYEEPFEKKVNLLAIQVRKKTDRMLKREARKLWK